MTTITVDRAVLEQALEAMKKITAHPKNFWDLEEEIAALSTALAEQQQKPVAWQWLNTAHFRKNLPANAESGAWNPLYTHPPRRETEQEPVAWIQSNHLQQARREPFLCRVEPTQRLSDFVPLYTHPPRREWQSLSEVELNLIYAQPQTHQGQYARAIEAALKEKNHG